MVQLASETGHDEMEQTAETIERVLLAEKHLMPNVDWPTARLYHYLDLPKELYTPLFAVSRVAGWSAHVIEMLEHGRLLRPMAKYIGRTAAKLDSDRATMNSSDSDLPPDDSPPEKPPRGEEELLDRRIAIGARSAGAVARRDHANR